MSVISANGTMLYLQIHFCSYEGGIVFTMPQLKPKDNCQLNEGSLDVILYPFNIILLWLDRVHFLFMKLKCWSEEKYIVTEYCILIKELTSVKMVSKRGGQRFFVFCFFFCKVKLITIHNSLFKVWVLYTTDFELGYVFCVRITSKFI